MVQGRKITNYGHNDIFVNTSLKGLFLENLKIWINDIDYTLRYQCIVMSHLQCPIPFHAVRLGTGFLE